MYLLCVGTVLFISMTHEVYFRIYSKIIIILFFFIVLPWWVLVGYFCLFSNGGYNYYVFLNSVMIYSIFFKFCLQKKKIGGSTRYNIILCPMKWSTAFNMFIFEKLKTPVRLKITKIALNVETLEISGYVNFLKAAFLFNALWNVFT